MYIYIYISIYLSIYLSIYIYIICLTWSDFLCVSFLRTCDYHPGGLDFAVHAAGFNSLNNAVFSVAWMVPCVADESCQTCLEFDTETTQFSFTFGGEDHGQIKLTYAVLRATESSICFVKEINGNQYAVLKRGLLLLGNDQSSVLHSLIVWSSY